MRVALDGFPLSAPKTGVGHYTFELARTLAEISPNDTFELISPFPFTDTVIQELQQTALPNLILSNPTGYRRRWWAIGLPLFLRQNSFDVFHGTNYDVPLWSRKRNVLTIHDLSLQLHPQFHEAKLIRRARKRLPLMIRCAALVIAVTESIKCEICEHLKVKPERVVVTPEAPRKIFRPLAASETSAVRQRLGIRQDFILSVGTIEPRKNLLTLVRAFDRILRTTSLTPQLVIAGGKGWLMEDFYSFIRSSGTGENIRLIGYTSDYDLRALYSSCRVCVYPSLYEGFGLPPLEAMACGAPLITSQIPAITETVGNSAVLVDPLNVEEIASSIVKLWSDPSERNRLSQAGIDRAARFTWEQTAKLTFEVYRELVSGTVQ
jgi:glycosyltransferase involved in cell wall biosynthesis